MGYKGKQSLGNGRLPPGETFWDPSICKQGWETHPLNQFCTPNIICACAPGFFGLPSLSKDENTIFRLCFHFSRQVEPPFRDSGTALHFGLDNELVSCIWFCNLHRLYRTEDPTSVHGMSILKSTLTLKTLMASTRGIFSFSYMLFLALSAFFLSLAANLAFVGADRPFTLRT